MKKNDFLIWCHVLASLFFLKSNNLLVFFLNNSTLTPGVINFYLSSDGIFFQAFCIRSRVSTLFCHIGTRESDSV